jgi:hypothetical protein
MVNILAELNSLDCIDLVHALYCNNFYFPCCRLYSNEDARDKIIRILHVTSAGDEIIDDVLLHNAITMTLGTIQSGCIRNWMVAFSNVLHNPDSALEKLECMTPPSMMCYDFFWT